MGKRGPKPRHPQLEVLLGGPGHRPLRSVAPARPVRPRCPRWLPAEARKLWRAKCRDLEAVGLIASVDGEALAGWALSMIRLRQAEEAIENAGSLTYEYTNKAGETNLIPRPEVGIAVKYHGLMKAYSAMFGFAPADRVGLVAPGQRQGADEMGELIAGAR